LKNNEFAEHLQKEQKNIFLLITGPISGPFKYFLKLKRRISSFYENLPDKWKKRVYIGFKFGKDSGENLVRKDLEKISMTELYQASDLVFLLSSTEGRGLPIIESAAAGVPLLVTKFEPKQTFEEVSEDLWAFVWEYKKKKQVIQAVVPYILDSDARIRLASKNQAVVKKRFSYKVLEDQLLYILKKSWRHTNHEAEAKRLAHQEISTLLKQRKNSLKDLVYDKNRTYIPGYNPLGFMFCIKSLNEPSFFRQEYLDLRSRLFCFGNTFVDRVKVNPKKRYLFYKALETMLTLTRGKEKIIVDHSFIFRFRTDKHFLYYQLTEQELKGAIVLLARNVFGKDFDSFKLSGSKRRQIDTSLEKLKALSEQNNEWEDMVRCLFPEVKPASLRLLRRELYNKPRPIIFFLGPLDRVPLYLKVFVEVVLSHWLAKDKKATSQLRIYLVVNKNPFFNSTTVQDVNEILERKEFRFFKKYVKTGIVSILSESTHTQGFNCYGASSRLKKIVSKIKTDKGLALSSGEDMFVTLDLLDLPSFRFGTAETAMFCRYTGLPQGKSFIQYMPAGIRPVLNYPYPTQQVTEFESFVCKHADKSESFWEKVKIRQDETGESLNSSINFILNNNSYEKKSSILCGKIAGKYESGMPWTAAYFKVNYPTLREQHDELQFHLLESDKKKKQSILELICQFERENKKKVVCGMNGGFILNNELVGKLGLSSDFLGVPLGLTITQGKVKSLPLFNRPALIFTSKGKVFTDRISLPPGKMWVTSSPKQSLLVWSEKQINSTNLKISEEVVVYTLQHDAKVSTKNRVLVVICGNKVASIYIPRFRSMSKEYKSLLPVGITFSFPKKLFEKKYSQYYKVGQTVGFELELEKKWGSIEEAIEAGPLLIKEGQIAIDMEIEGWKTKHSLKTQANRLDKLNLQGPKIGLGMTKTGDIIGVSVEGRIRESVGATYPQLAEILLSMGAWEGLAFDPGGSASLYANGNLLNLSPYDPNFDRLVYFGSSQPRGIGNAFILSRNKK
ncbi:MAG: phosphodiester glycosidase family protein, partial [Patescibacteria group bacterium]